MSKEFTEAEWAQINEFLDAHATSNKYDIPENTDNSVLFASWNIRKFGVLNDDEGNPSKSKGAFNLLVRFCKECDLIAIQEVLENTESIYALKNMLNQNGGSYELIMSDVTGKVPGYDGMAERSAFLYNRNKIRLGEIASDLSFDRSAVLDNIRDAYSHAFAAEFPEGEQPSKPEMIWNWLINLPRLADSKIKKFVQFIRTPHLIEFIIDAKDDGKPYVIQCVNAHLVSGESKTERSNEFFALLEWLVLQSSKTVVDEQKIVMLLADLNLDFKSDVKKRRLGIESYIATMNEERKLKARVNFPFLDGNYFTNARETETFDHIAYISNDPRWPRARHNHLAGTLSRDDFDYGMFNFSKAFRDAGPAAGEKNTILYDRFSHDLTDHMPIWMRMPIPNKNQRTFWSNED